MHPRTRDVRNQDRRVQRGRSPVQLRSVHGTVGNPAWVEVGARIDLLTVVMPGMTGRVGATKGRYDKRYRECIRLRGGGRESRVHKQNTE